ncbi:MAG: hypothetical protein CBC83_02270 [Flavobacteriales bacterium TMED123]|nr:hypothetical protein [Candidatus Neomarinimicrobiota bacterium]MAJ44507.1 hypothetical protein [Candidatus Neomarinimicrobiota bacterium]OUV73943.1 MAG: hypothetical protein CBC83_04715 [Flavobacteriales bacterium TMED123]OUV75584.1 MAG: hypothetical protein CBC83_02270 [Flavobacteriales bacterium TMED123]|tara:strand:+ start:1051 stop:1338 length:288 start_codon:yes stop_codon:yes gene_type:complete
MAKWKEFDIDPNPRLDVVTKPEHYNQAGIECIDAMKAMTKGIPKCRENITAHQSYCWQNCFKYLWRWPYKNGIEDLKKARWYLDRLIQEIQEDAG